MNEFKSQLKIGSMIAAALIVLASAIPANALPVLQMYLEGARYDQDSDAWITGSSDLTLWVVGNTGENGTIADVKLTAAFLTGETGNISITPTQTTLLADPSMSATPILNSSVGADGTTPVMSSGEALPDHGIYGSGVSFSQWELGDLSLTDSAIGDFTGSFPSSLTGTGQINAYNISVSGYSMIHFDTFNHVEAPSHTFYSSFSSPSAVPEPSSILLLGMGLGGGLAFRRLRRKEGADSK
jgi:hypothetical protein